MATREFKGVAILCDVCGYEYDIEGGGFTQFFDNAAEAADAVGGDDWTTRQDGSAVCGASDTEHIEARKVFER